MFIRYVREKDVFVNNFFRSKGKPYAVIISDGNNIGWSMCHKKDVFKKKTAVALAKERIGEDLLKAPACLKEAIDKMVVFIKNHKTGKLPFYKCVKINHFMEGCHPNGIENGFAVKGVFLKPPTVGERFEIRGIRAEDWLDTSPVTEITETGFKTKNSEYKLTLIK